MLNRSDSLVMDSLNKELVIIQQKLKMELLKEKELNDKAKDIDKEYEESNKTANKSLNKLGAQRKEIEKCTKEIDNKIEKLKQKIKLLEGKNSIAQNTLDNINAQELAVANNEKHHKLIPEQKVAVEPLIAQDKINATIKQMKMLKGKLDRRNFGLDQKAKLLEQEIYNMKLQREQLKVKEKDFEDMLKIIEEEERVVEKREKELDEREAQVIPGFSLDAELDIKTEEFEKTSIRWQRYKEKCYKHITENYRKLRSKEETLKSITNK